MRFIRDVVLVAVFDLAESLRSRRAMLLLLLYLAGSMAATGIFIRVLQEVENTVASALRTAHTDRPGSMTGSLVESEEFVKLLGGLVGDPDLARELVQIPVLALFYGWLAFAFVPVLVTLTSSDAVAGEVATGSCRFALFRTARSSWATGKLVGQALLLAVGVLVGAAGTFAVGAGWLVGFEPAATAWWLLRLGLRAWIHGFAWLGIILGVSQLTRSAHWARALAVLALVGGWIAGNVLGSDGLAEKVGVVAPTLYQLYPGAHQLDLWRPALADRLPAVVFLLALGGLYFLLGHLRFARRDA